ncbi:hypothetical protein FRB93_008303 [Tulasnella sp. JGI-2019a]|nr:hypothetical protein FRB93_008303 [Tulasnella sp. JGI-2019a]
MKVDDIIHSFHPERVRDDNGLQKALLHLGRLSSEAKQTPGGMEKLIVAVLNAPLSSLAPFVLFYMRPHIGDPHHFVSLFFPTDPYAFPTAGAHRLLLALRDFFLTAVPSYDTPREFSYMHLRVSNAPVLLEEVSKLHQSMAGISPLRSNRRLSIDDGGRDQGQDFGFPVKAKRKNQQGNKNGGSSKGHRRTTSQAVQIDDKVFRTLGITVPTNPTEIEALAKEILVEQSDILVQYMVLLQTDAMGPYVISNHLGTQNAQDDSVQSKDNRVTGVATDQVDDGLVKTVPSAFPIIQPMRAARYFEEQAADLGDWPIYISTRAFRHLRQLDGGDAAVFDIVRKKIRELSHGHFSDSNQKVLVGNGNEEVPIFEAKMTGDLRLVYQVDCGSLIEKYEDGSESKYEKQQLRVYGIFTHAQLDKRLWASVAAQSQKRGSEYRRRCIWREVAKIKSKGVNVTPPAVFPPRPEGEERARDVSGQVSLGDADYLELHDILALEKFIPYSHTLLDTIRGNEDVAHVFDVSPKEDEIIYHGSSCLVVGRSGTGKTTTMLFKMIALERAAGNTGDKIRQIFVTQSRVLAGRVEEYFHKLVLSSQPTKATAEAPKGKGSTTTKPQQELLDLDDEVEDDERLPGRWSDLQDHHFPLFLTFDQLCRLLEGDCNLTYHRDSLTRAQRSVHGRYALKSVTDTALDLDSLEAEDTTLSEMKVAAFKSRKEGLLTFERFQTTIWPHFDAGLVKNIDPALVFSEFMGVIRGCEESLATPNGYLDRSTYENISVRMQSTFARSRPKIYSLFEAYLKQKRILNCYDAPERTHALLKSANRGVTGKLVDFLYVDEAQDNLLIDAGLLRSLCKSPHGMFFAGDTAQTIAIGSSFRFDDLKAYLYRIEEADLMVKEGKRQAVHPAFFQLSVNYRSHGGIVNAATSVVSLITKLFPHSIDALAPERGMVDGPKPVFFTGWGEDVRYEQFLFGESNTPIEFGAEQVILVRTEIARETLRAQIGSEIGLILTLYESKGLEFSDVLLYDFFADSPASAADWRVILTALDESERHGIPAPRFDETRHAAIQSELKFLYVGLTRARKHVWLWDSSSIGDAMKVFWQSKGLIEICKKGDKMPMLAVQSTNADWAKSGRLLFAKKLYPQSIFCFEKADMPLEKAIAEAYLSRQQARRLLSHDPKRSAAFVASGSAFEEAAALSADMPTQRKKLFLAAAECFIQGGRRIRAAKAYYNAEEYTESALEYRKAKSYDQAVQVIHTHRASINPTIAEEIISVVKLVYVKADQLTKARHLFEKIDDYLEFLDEYGMDDAKLAVLESLGRYDEAAALQKQLGRDLAAIHSYLQSTNPLSHERAAKSTLEALWGRFYLGTVPRKEDKTVQELLKLGETALAARPEMDMFKMLQSGTPSQVAAFGRRFVEIGNNPCALLSYDCALRKPDSLRELPLDGVILVLEHYLRYGSVLRDLRSTNELARRVTVQQALHFIPIIDAPAGDEPAGDAPAAVRRYIIGPSSILFARANQRSMGGRENNNNIVLPADEVDLVIKRALADRYNLVMGNIATLAQSSRVLQPCPEHAATGVCPRKTCHRDHSAMDNTTFTRRVRAIAMIVIIVNSIYMEPGTAEHSSRSHTQRLWLSRIFQCLFPIVSNLGSLPNLDIGFPEYKLFLGILKTWLQEGLNALNPQRASRHFMGEFLSMALLAYSLDHAGARQYGPRIPCASSRLPTLIHRNGEITVVEESLVWLTGKEPYSLMTGVLSARHVSEMMAFPIDINAFIGYLELLTSHLIINRSLQDSRLPGDAKLHRVTLPRTWAIAVLARTSPECRTQTVVAILVDAFDNLLHSLTHPEASRQYLLEGRILMDCHQVTQSLLASRVCQALVILGHNYWQGVRDRIINLLQRIGQHSQLRHATLQPYLLATRWSELAVTMRKSMYNCPTNELCILLHTSQDSKQFAPTPGIRIIHYATRNDLLTKIGFFENPIPLISTLNPKVKEFIPAPPKAVVPIAPPEPKPIETHENAATDGEPTTDPTLPAEEAPDFVEEDGADEEPIRVSFGVATTDHEEKAARIFQKHWKRHNADDRKLGNFFFTDCLLTLDKIEQLDAVKQKYKKYYLGPLPHVLYYLEKIGGSGGACKLEKKQVQKRLREMEDPAEHLMKKVTQFSLLEKDLATLRKKLHPGSDLHKACSLENLKEAVREIEAIKTRIDRLLPPQPSSTTEEYNLGWKGLLKVAVVKPTVKEEKPALNTEDLLDS